MKILIIDNYDSFTYNLAHIVKQVTKKTCEVIRNDQLEIESVELYDKIIISPGPGIPDDAGLTKAIIQLYAGTKSILGICLGMQAIAECFGGKILNHTEIFHGIATPVRITERNHYLFKNLPENIVAGRYHSWIVEKKSLPANLIVIAVDKFGIPMGLRHREYDVCGLQFHPESILTEHGEKIITNWLNGDLTEPICLPSASDSKFRIAGEIAGNKLFC